jgi:hypothetical protein
MPHTKGTKEHEGYPKQVTCDVKESGATQEATGLQLFSRFPIFLIYRSLRLGIWSLGLGTFA